MQHRRVGERLESLEVRVTRLEEMPARLDAVVVEVADLCAEMRAGFSEMRDGFAAVRQEAADESQRLRTEFRGYGDGLFAMAVEHVDKRHAEAMTQTRALHEEVIDRLKRIRNS